MNSRVSALGRMIDIRYASNRFVVAAAGLGGAATLVYRIAADAGDPLLWAFRVAAAVFLAWALARELDPDHPVSAAVAAIAAGPAVALAPPEIGAMAGFIIAVRIIVRSTGMSAHPWELAAVVLFVAYLAAGPAGWPAAIALTWAMWIDGSHEHIPHPPSRIAALVAAAAAIAVAVVTFPTDLTFDRSWPATLVFLAGILAAWLAVNRMTAPVSTGDHDRAPLSPHRLALGRIMAGVGLGLAAVLTRLEPAAYGPLWTAIVATAVVAVARRASVETSR